MSKVQNFELKSQFPVGIVRGIEIFEDHGEPYAMFPPVGKIRFDQLPKRVKRFFEDKFMKDTNAHIIIESVFNITGWNAAYKKWLCCKYGGYDFSPDFENDRIQPVEYNNSCANFNCKARGKLCKIPFNLKPHEIDTIKEVQKGKTIESMCDTLCISRPGLNNRIKSIKEKMGVLNTVQIAVKAIELGIK